MAHADKTPDFTEGVNYKLNKSPEEWRNLLTDMEFFVLREAGTERPGTGELLHENRSGIYHCRACDAELFSSEKKFDSHCGWPSFYDPDEKGAVVYIEDRSLAPRVRTEVRCATCGSHLGHVFNDSPQTPTGMRYCMNSVALRFEPASGQAEGQAGVQAEGQAEGQA